MTHWRLSRWLVQPLALLPAVLLLAIGTVAASDTSGPPRTGHAAAAPVQSAERTGPPGRAAGGLPTLPESFRVTAMAARPAQTQSPTWRPTRLQLPSGAVVAVRATSTSPRGRLRVPDDVERAGWWDGGARLGDRYGAMVMASHVDSTTQGLGPFAELLEADPGDPVSVSSPHTRQTFAVSDNELVARADLAAREDIFSATGDARLVLVTCAPPYLPDEGGYQNLAVVTAVPLGQVRPS